MRIQTLAFYAVVSRSFTKRLVAGVTKALEAFGLEGKGRGLEAVESNDPHVFATQVGRACMRATLSVAWRSECPTIACEVRNDSQTSPSNVVRTLRGRISCRIQKSDWGSVAILS